MRIRLAIPDKYVDGETLNSLLEATTRAGVRQIERGEAPLLQEAIKRGVRWQPERFTDGEHFDLPAEANQRGWGDCDDLGPWDAASLRASGEDPGARAVAMRSGPTRWHVVTKRSDGRIQDPSKRAGMGSRVNGVCGFAARPLALPGDGAIALLPRGRHWWGRCDLPWEHAHVASIAPARSPQEALAKAVVGALDCGQDIVDEVYARYAERMANDLLSSPYGESFVRELCDSQEGDVVGQLLRVGAPQVESFPEFVRRHLASDPEPADVTTTRASLEGGPQYDQAYFNALYDWVSRLAEKAARAGYRRDDALSQWATAIQQGTSPVTTSPGDATGPRGSDRGERIAAWVRAVQNGFDAVAQAPQTPAAPPGGPRVTQATLPGGSHLAWEVKGPLLVRF